MTEPLKREDGIELAVLLHVHGESQPLVDWIVKNLDWPPIRARRWVSLNWLWLVSASERVTDLVARGLFLEDKD